MVTLISLLLWLVCGVEGEICKSPRDLIMGDVTGGTTLHLPQYTRKLKVTVMMERKNISGVSVLRLTPADMDASKCNNTTPESAVTEEDVYCYKYMEIRWSSTSSGSDHAIQGKRSDMEIQHYLRRTQGNMTKTPVAVGVLTHSMAEQHSLPNTPYKRAVADIVKLLKNETQKMNLTMEDLLPPVDQPYYQYSGSVPGSCSEETEWLVYEVEMNTTSELLHTLRMQSDVQSFFDMVQASSDIFYSNWSGASNGIKLQAAKMQPNEINETSSEMETPEANKNVMEPAEGTLSILMPVSNTVPIFPEATLVASEVISMSLQSVVPERTRTQNTTLPFSTSRSTTHSNIDSLEKAPSSNGSSTNQLNKEMSHTAPSSELQTTTSVHTITPVDSGLESNFNMHANGTSSSSGLESPLVHTQTTETLGSQGMAPVPKLFAFVGVIVTIFFIL